MERSQQLRPGGPPHRRGGQRLTGSWPTDPDELEQLQRKIAGLRPLAWTPPSRTTVGGCFVCFARGGAGPGSAGDPAWAAAVVMDGPQIVARGETTGEAPGPYIPGMLAAREGSLLHSAVLALTSRPDVLLVNATGRDHPRRAGLALHLGWALDMPTIGVTHRPLAALGDPPGPWQGSRTPLSIDEEQVGWWLRTRAQARPIAVTPGWAIDLDTSAHLVGAMEGRARTPEPIRQARRLARTARSASQQSW